MIKAYKAPKGLSRKSIESHIKKTGSKDITNWCTQNIPCPADDRPMVTVTDGNPPRSRDVAMQGVMPFDLSGRDCSEWVLDFLDMRKHTLDSSNTLLTRDTSFSKAILAGASLVGSNCRDTPFDGCNLEMAVLNSVIFANCSFEGSNLAKASLTSTVLDRSLLKAVQAPGAQFINANLEYADLTSSFVFSPTLIFYDIKQSPKLFFFLNFYQFNFN